MTTATEDTNQTSKRPTHVAYSVKDRGENKKSEWRAIGVAWAHADAKGFNVVLDMMPLDGRITLRAAQDDRKERE
ncbi:MAG: hypothetical protein U0790_17755 [Isosphaeraceae bacterium]